MGDGSATSTPPVSTRRKRVPAHSHTTSLRSRVTPGVSWTTAWRVPVRRLTSVDFPTLGKPTTATVPASEPSISRGEPGADELLDPLDDLVDAQLRGVDLRRVLGGLHLRRIARVP